MYTKKIMTDMLLDEYEAAKRIIKQEKENKEVRSFLKRVYTKLKDLNGYTIDDVKKRIDI